MLKSKEKGIVKLIRGRTTEECRNDKQVKSLTELVTKKNKDLPNSIKMGKQRRTVSALIKN